MSNKKRFEDYGGYWATDWIPPTVEELKASPAWERLPLETRERIDREVAFAKSPEGQRLLALEAKIRYESAEKLRMERLRKKGYCED